MKGTLDSSFGLTCMIVHQHIDTDNRYRQGDIIDPSFYCIVIDTLTLAHDPRLQTIQQSQDRMPSSWNDPVRHPIEISVSNKIVLPKVQVMLVVLVMALAVIPVVILVVVHEYYCL
ncbi:uncharacterized protein BX664DRAFT_353509 [Halteromyces radiatus]|uniref:uncharacterized protein n=1 Tax=Halteromyces radiatus TaxID=101107 RepID=UPI00221FB78B|nr:uncharacterized protein BX664DRAFT_353509 [Halteromyces radiatus]KAI8077670.1 hypothetical protein BX664DRAFT_353509 [Halteromyces radiatus]